MSDNPFSAPSTGGSIYPASATSDAWAEGDILVTSTDSVLPLVCAKCGTHEGVEHIRLKAQWAPIWVRLTIIASPMIMLILWFIFKKNCDIQVGLCDTHRTQRRIGQVVGYTGLGLGIVAMIAGCGLIDISEELAVFSIFGGLVILLIGVIMVAVMAIPMRVQKITDENAYFKGVNQGLLDAVS